MVVVSGSDFQVEIRGDVSSVERIKAALSAALAGDEGVKVEDVEVVDVTEEDWFKDALKRLTPNRVLEIRLENKGMRVKDLVEKTGIAQSAISGMLSGKRVIGPIVAKRLAEVLGCEASDFDPL